MQRQKKGGAAAPTVTAANLLPRRGLFASPTRYPDGCLMEEKEDRNAVEMEQLAADDVPEYRPPSSSSSPMFDQLRDGLEQVHAALGASALRKATSQLGAQSVMASVMALIFAWMALIWAAVVIVMSGGGLAYRFFPSSGALPLEAFSAVLVVPFLAHALFETLKLAVDARWLRLALAAVASTMLCWAGVTLALVVRQYIAIMDGSLPATPTQQVGIYAALFGVILITLFEACVFVTYLRVLYELARGCCGGGGGNRRLAQL